MLQLRRHELEDAQESSGLSTAAAEGTRAVSAIEDGDWVALNNRINLTNMNKEITLRYGAGAAGVVVGTPRVAVEVRQGSPDRSGASDDHAERHRRRATTTPTRRQTFPLNFTGSQRLFLVFRAVAGGPTTNIAQHQLGRVQRPGVTP